MVPAMLLPAFLVAENVVRSDGAGAAVPVDPTRNPLLEITLGITRILEKESLHVSVWGSADGEAWLRLRSFPPKSYCGSYAVPLDLSSHAEVRFLRAQWTMGRWGLGAEAPVFGFSIEIRAAEIRAAEMKAAELKAAVVETTEKKSAAGVGTAVGVA